MFYANFNQKFVYLITTKQMIKYQLSDLLNNQSNAFVAQSFIERNVIHKAIVYRNYLMLACGIDGADIYGLQKNDVQKIKTLQGEDINFMDISAHKNELYILDNNSGLLFYEFYGSEITLQQDKKIKIKKGQQFAQYEGKLFFILYQLNFEIQKLAEIFYKDHKFYVNNAYDYMQQVYEIKLFDEMVAIIDTQIQTFIYHSINEHFLEDKNKHFDYYGYRYQETGLKHIELISFDMIPRLIVGISADKLVAVELQVNAAKILCYFPQIQSKDLNIGGEELNYMVSMNSTICPSQSYYNEYDQFTMCNIKQKIHVEFIELIDNKGQNQGNGNTWLIVGLSCLGLTVVLFLCRKYYLSTVKLTQELNELRSKYQKLEQETI